MYYLIVGTDRSGHKCRLRTRSLEFALSFQLMRGSVWRVFPSGRRILIKRERNRNGKLTRY